MKKKYRIYSDESVSNRRFYNNFYGRNFISYSHFDKTLTKGEAEKKIKDKAPLILDRK